MDVILKNKNHPKDIKKSFKVALCTRAQPRKSTFEYFHWSRGCKWSQLHQ